MKSTLAIFIALVIISSCNHRQPLNTDIKDNKDATTVSTTASISIEEKSTDTTTSTPRSKIIPPSLPELTPIVAHFHNYQYVEGICDHGYTGQLPDLPYKNHTELNFKCDTLTKNEYNQDSYQRFRVHYFQYTDSTQGGMARDSLLACFPGGCHNLLAHINENREEHYGIKCPTSLFIMNKTSIMIIYHDSGSEKNWHEISNFIVKEYAEDDAEIITQNVFNTSDYDWGWHWHTLESYFQVFKP